MMMDPLTRLSYEAIERRLLQIDRQFAAWQIEDMRKMLAESPPGIVVSSENPVKVLKVKKDIPTVIEYQGRRYVLDNGKR